MDTRNELRGFLKQSQQTTCEINNEVGVRTKRSSHSGGKACVNKSLEHNDELLKYMSKLPGYLQRMERKEESVQSNVLNVGVLDWGRLEKWKHGRARDEILAKVATTSTSGLLVVPNESHRCKVNKASQDLQHSSVHGVRCTLESEFASRDSLNKQDIATCSYNSSYGRDHEGVNPGKSRRSRSFRETASGVLSEMGNSGAKGNLVGPDKETQKRATESGKQCVDKVDGEEKIIGSNVVLLGSRKQSQSSTLSGVPQMLLDDDNMRLAKEVNLSLDFSHVINSSFGLRSQIPRSCSISFDLERDSEDMMMLPLGVDLSGKKERSGGRRHSKTASRIFDLEIPQDESRKNRHLSPSKRFSFSFGHLSRSFTFKEDSAGLPLSSFDDTFKTDSMRFDGLACPSQLSNLEKQNIHGGSRVSPLRRLLDPLLKSKASENVLPSKARSSSTNPKPTNSDVPLQDEKKRDTSRTRALFQLTIRNGIPLYQFVVDDNNINSSSRSILGVTMKSSASSFKDDSVQYFTFYSVSEVKKKKSGSWLIHGHKEKECGFVYSVIGQMQLSNSMSSDITEEKFENISRVIRESVLFDEAEQVKGRKEIAAVVIKKKPVEENYIGTEETSVIIPGGIHSFPEKGAPSPLISRWRSGGLCDCGGWDVGCKLHVFSNKTLLYDEFNQSFNLFNQEGSEQESGGPALAMTELKTGIYRVEFGSFISALQAFFVCVTVLTYGSEAKTTGKSSSPLAPPLSPVGRV